MKRTQIREQIFKLLFRREFNSENDMPEQVKLFFENPSIEEDEINIKDVSLKSTEELYIREKYNGIVEKIEELDKAISSTSKGWTIDRISKVDLTILRLAIFEIKYDDEIPNNVAIDEAVELAKKFGQDESSSFVNGILANIAKQE